MIGSSLYGPLNLKVDPFPRARLTSDGTTVAYDCRMRFLERALLASCKSRTQLSSFNIAYTYDCRRILKHVLKSYDIFCDVHDSCKRVVGLIYTKQTCRRPVVTLSHATKSYRVNRPLRATYTVRLCRMRQAYDTNCFV